MKQLHFSSGQPELGGASRRALVLAAVTAPALLAAGCAVTRGSETSSASKRREIDTGVDATLNRLYTEVRGSRELAAKSRGVLVFPSILAAGLVVGGEYGEGALRVGGRTQGYYRATSASFGFQAGAQSKSLIMMFMTQDALDKFVNSKGWTAGADASVAFLRVGANGEIDTTSASQAVNAFALTNAGLMANLTIEGTKFSRIDL